MPRASIIVGQQLTDHGAIRTPAECDRKSIYLLRLEIETACCFAEKQVLSLADSNGSPSRWTLLVGDSDVGLTTLLQCMTSVIGMIAAVAVIRAASGAGLAAAFS